MALQNKDWREQEFNSQNYRDFFRIGGGLSFFVLGLAAGALFFGADMFSYITNLYTEGMGVVFTVLVLNYLADRRAKREREADLKVRLVREAGSPDNATALNAVREIRGRSWLAGRDGLLKNAYLIRADLSGAELMGANLEGVIFSDTNLEGADFECVNLQDTYFRGANLKGVNFGGAYLGGADFEDAKLEGAYFGGAYLEEVELVKLPDGRVKGINPKNVLVSDIIFDENITLPDGTKWTPDTDWTRFGAFTDVDEWRDSQQSGGE